MRNAAHPQMWSLNQLHVEGPRPGLRPAELAAELDRGLAHARHRRAIVADDSTGRALADGMRRAGFGVTPLMVMLLDSEPPAPRPGLAHEIDEGAMRALERRLAIENPEVPDADRAAVLEGLAHTRAAIPGTRMFAGIDDGKDVCQTTLFARDGIGQPENVETLRAHRGRGLAAATVSLATREAVAAGCGLVFVLCGADTGPFALYAGLGFRAAGRFWSFTRRA